MGTRRWRDEDEGGSEGDSGDGGREGRRSDGGEVWTEMERTRATEMAMEEKKRRKEAVSDGREGTDGVHIAVQCIQLYGVLVCTSTVVAVLGHNGQMAGM